MFSFSFDFGLPFNNYKEIIDINKKSPFPYIWWGVNISRSNTILRFYVSLNLFRERHSNSVFFISIGLFTFYFDFNIIDVRNKRD